MNIPVQDNENRVTDTQNNGDYLFTIVWDGINDGWKYRANRRDTDGTHSQFQRQIFHLYPAHDDAPPPSSSSLIVAGIDYPSNITPGTPIGPVINVVDSEENLSGRITRIDHWEQKGPPAAGGGKRKKRKYRKRKTRKSKKHKKRKKRKRKTKKKRRKHNKK